VLTVLTTHPIQYQIPLWKELAARKNIPFKVLYMSDQGLETRFDSGFGKTLSWDIDLLGGYQFEFLDIYKGPQWDSFWGLRLKHGFVCALRGMETKVLWIQGWQVVAYWQAVLAARKVGAEVWLRGETNSRSNAGGIGRQFKRPLLRQLLRRTDRLLYIGKANRRFYQEQGISTERLSPAPYCVDNLRFATTAAAIRNRREHIRSEWGIPPEAFCFVFVGKFIRKKRPFDLIEAARRFQHAHPGKQIHLLWVGTGELARELRQACNVCFDVESGGHVQSPGAHDELNGSFVGFLNQSEISRAYVAADCLVLPSDAKETWGLVVNEAMASDLPCIVSSACGCAEDLVQPIRPDLCYPMGDVIALESAMTAVIKHAPTSELLREHISNYDVSRTIDTVESLYFETLSRASSSSSRVLER
jgi:glycosyltransferase involved in cell wall biosynthesis